jgi:hypothetical protein
LAKAGQVVFVGASHTHASELGFNTKGAMECIEWLELAEYRTTLTYDDGKSWDDYVATRKCPISQQMRAIYIKLRVVTIQRDGAGEENVIVTSFHTEKPI